MDPDTDDRVRIVAALRRFFCREWKRFNCSHALIVGGYCIDCDVREEDMQ